MTIPIQEVLERHRGEKHLIALHDSPDPDSVASAFAYKLISAEYGIETSIYYRGRINRQQNHSLVKLLGIELINIAEHHDLNGFDGAVLVDCQGVTCESIVTALEKAGVPVLLVIDHGDPEYRISPEFSDVRRTGSTSTIFASYLQDGLSELEKTRKEHASVATALYYGILSGTNNFVTAQPGDLAAAAFLSRYRDADFLDNIMSQTRTKSVMEIIRQALSDRQIIESFSVAGVGFLRAEDREAISQAANFLLTEENVHTTIVYGIILEGDQRETLIGSMCTSKITLNVEEFLSKVFGKSIDSELNPAENLSAGSFAIPIGFLAGDSTDQMQELKWQVYDAQVKHKVISRIGVPREQLESSNHKPQPKGSET